MAQEKSGANAPNMTAAEMEQWIKDNERALRNYKAALDPLRALRDITKPAKKKVQSLTKENIVQYLQNPLQNEGKLRDASWYLFIRNQIYQRIIIYYSTLFCLDAMSVIPKFDLVARDTDEKILESYNKTLKMYGGWNVNNEFLKVIITCMVQDVSYNCAYADDTGLYLLPLPPDYCKIYAQYPDGSFAFMMDMNYFKGTNRWLIDEWGEPFVSMYRAFEAGGNAARWQLMPAKYSCCLKMRNYDYEVIIPPFSGILGDLINLNDIEDIQSVSDAMEVYRLVYLKLKTITGSKMPDDFEVSPQVAIEYFNRMLDDGLLPDYTSAAIVPGSDDLGVIDFSNTDHANEVNKVLKTTKAVLNTSGGAQILNSADITGSTAFHATLHADENFSMSSLLPQIEGVVNRLLSFVVKDASKVKYFFVGRFTRDEFRSELLEDAQYSLPTKLAIMSLSGINPIDALALNHLEENILKLNEKFVYPLNSSYTVSADEGGRPTLDDDEISDDGDSSRTKSDKAG